MFEFLPAFVSTCCLWYAMAVVGELQGRGFFVRNVIAGTLALLLGFFVLALMLSGWFGVFLGFSSALVTANFLRIAVQKKRAGPQEGGGSKAAQGVTFINPARPDKHAIAREDLSRPNPEDVIDVVKFDYRDRDGEQTERTVDVTGIDDDYFEGWCRDRKAIRTFRIDRVEGDLLSLRTGELNSADAWAVEAESDFRNEGVDQGKWFKRK